MNPFLDKGRRTKKWVLKRSAQLDLNSENPWGGGPEYAPGGGVWPTQSAPLKVPLFLDVPPK